MYIVIFGKVGIFSNKENYKKVKDEDRNHQRLVAISC